MTVLNFDDVIRKSRDLDYHFCVFWKILFSTTLMPSFIANYGLTSSGFMMEDPFRTPQG